MVDKNDIARLQQISDLLGYNTTDRARVLGLANNRAFANMQKWDPKALLLDLKEALHLNISASGTDRVTVMHIVRLSPDLYQPFVGGERFTFGDLVVTIKDSYSEMTKKKFYALVERLTCMQAGYAKARKEYSIFTLDFDIKKSLLLEPVGDGSTYKVVPNFDNDDVNDAIAAQLKDHTFTSNSYMALMEVVGQLCDSSMFSMDKILESIVKDLQRVDEVVVDENTPAPDYGAIYRQLTANRAVRGADPGMDVLSKMFVARFPTSDLDPCVKIAHAIYELRKTESVADPAKIALLTNGHESSIRSVVEQCFPGSSLVCYTLGSRAVEGFIPTTAAAFCGVVAKNPLLSVISDGLVYDEVSVGKKKMSHAHFSDNRHQFLLLSDFDCRRAFTIATLPLPYLAQVDMRDVLATEFFRVVQSPTRHSGVMVGYISPSIVDQQRVVLSDVDNIVYRAHCIDQIRQWVFDHGAVPPESLLLAQEKAANDAPYMQIVRNVKIGKVVPSLVAPKPKAKLFGSLSSYSRDSSEDEFEKPVDLGGSDRVKLGFESLDKIKKKKADVKTQFSVLDKAGNNPEKRKKDVAVSDKRVYPGIDQSSGKTSVVGTTATRVGLSGRIPGFDKKKTHIAAYTEYAALALHIPYEAAVAKCKSFVGDHKRMTSELREFVYRKGEVSYRDLLSHFKGLWGDLGKAIYGVHLCNSMLDYNNGVFKVNKASREYMMMQDTTVAMDAMGLTDSNLDDLLD